MIKNWKDVSKYNLPPLINKLPNTATFAMPIVMRDGRLTHKTFTKQTLLDTIENNFEVNSRTLGSDYEE
jgi:hypothetical protein